MVLPDRTWAVVVMSSWVACSACSWMADDATPEGPTTSLEITSDGVLELNSHFFDTASADLSQDGYNHLIALSGELVASFNDGTYTGPVCVEGHTDNRGTESENMSLSQRRAQTVEGVLKAEGVKNKITAVGKGESESTSAGSHEEARRVDVRLSACDPADNLQGSSLGRALTEGGALGSAAPADGEAQTETE